jgi:hypothetical protein
MSEIIAPPPVTPPPVTPPPAPGDAITITGLTWAKVLAILGALGASTLAIIGVLVGVVYNGINSRIDTLSSRVEGTEKTFREAVASGISVQDLLAKAPTLDRMINDTATKVSTITVQLQNLQQNTHDDATAIKQQLTELQHQGTETHDNVLKLQTTVSGLQSDFGHLIERLPPRKGGD